jgi:chromosomal replication initiation ATPase DnaA
VKAGISAEHAWCNALEQLQLEVPRSVFDEYVARSRLAAYDSATGAFTIAAPNAYSRDWMESRLAATLGRMLTGICYQSVEVRFVSRGEEQIAD